MRKPTDPNHLDPGSMRGRLVLAKALSYAIATIDKLPARQQEWSDRQDMANLLMHHPAFYGFADVAWRSANHHTGNGIDVPLPEDEKLKADPDQPGLHLVDKI
jgi:hypothetical protein